MERKVSCLHPGCVCSSVQGGPPGPWPCPATLGGVLSLGSCCPGAGRGGTGTQTPQSLKAQTCQLSTQVMAKMTLLCKCEHLAYLNSCPIYTCLFLKIANPEKSKIYKTLRHIQMVCLQIKTVGPGTDPSSKCCPDLLTPIQPPKGLLAEWSLMTLGLKVDFALRHTRAQTNGQ
jgi:hypothetical protein